VKATLLTKIKIQEMRKATNRGKEEMEIFEEVLTSFPFLL